MEAPRAVLFDLDGVLIDSYWVWFHLINDTARRLGYPPVSPGAYHRSWGQSTTADRDAFFPRHSVEEVERLYEEHYFDYVSHLTVFDDVPRVFRELRERGIRNAVVTNSQRSLASRIVERSGASPDAVVGGGDAPRGKPAPDLLLVACERLGVAPAETWMVGDSAFDKEAARAAGVFFVGLGIDGDRRVSRVSEVLDRKSAGGAPGVLDEALSILHRFGEEYGGGLSNHGPMAAEALVALGLSERVIPWVEGYLGRLEESPPPTRPIARDGWREALGAGERNADWRQFFERELDERAWRDALGLWLPRLLPGFAGAATHGAIRTSHAVRSIERGETPERRRELGRALAYWASCYEALSKRPVAPMGGRSGLSPRDAIERVEILSEEGRRGLISDALRRLASSTSFEGVVDLLDLSRDPHEILDDVVSTFARVYLQNAERAVIVFVHGVTGPAALRPLLPYLGPESRIGGVLYAWQAASGLFAAYGSPFDPAFEPEGHDLDPGDLSSRAAENGDDHVIKLTEVCLREWRRSGDPALLAAAEDVVGRL